MKPVNRTPIWIMRQAEDIYPNTEISDQKIHSMK